MNSIPQGGADDRSALDDQVAFWDARLRSPRCTDKDRAAFADWRDADPARAAAFAEFQGYLAVLQGAHRSAPELRAYRDEAMRVGGSRRWAIAASLAVFAGGAAAAFLIQSKHPALRASVVSADTPSIFQTAAGQRSTIILSDGSRATLDTRSRVEVLYAPGERNIRILTGQALFDVAKDASRPFVVTAGGQRVTAVGTVFSVRMDPGRVSVTLVEGKVRVGSVRPAGPRSSQPPEHRLVAGQQLVARDDSPEVKITWTDVVGATSWSEGRVVFQDTPLAEAVAEINRYSTVPVVVADEAAGRFRVSGMFKTDQPLTFARALPEYLPIKLESKPDQLVLASRR